MATFYRGVRVVKGGYGSRDEHHVQIKRAGREKLTVYVGLPKEESACVADREREATGKGTSGATARAGGSCVLQQAGNLREQVPMVLQILTNLIEGHIEESISDDARPCSSKGSDQTQEALRQLWDWLDEFEVFAVHSLTHKVCVAGLDNVFQSFMEVHCLGGRL